MYDTSQTWKSFGLRIFSVNFLQSSPIAETLSRLGKRDGEGERRRIWIMYKYGTEKFSRKF